MTNDPVLGRMLFPYLPSSSPFVLILASWRAFWALLGPSTSPCTLRPILQDCQMPQSGMLRLAQRSNNELKPWFRKHTFPWLSLIAKGWQHRNELVTRPEWNQPVRQELRVEGRRLDQVLRDLLGRDPGDQDRLLREGQPGPSGAGQLSRPWASGSPGPHLQRLSLSPQVTTQTFIPFCYFQAYYLDIFPQILPPRVGKTLIFLGDFYRFCENWFWLK